MSVISQKWYQLADNYNGKQIGSHVIDQRMVFQMTSSDFEALQLFQAFLMNYL